MLRISARVSSNVMTSTARSLLFGLRDRWFDPLYGGVTELLLCLQDEGESTLGAVLCCASVLGWQSTLGQVSAAAAIGARQASNRWPWLQHGGTPRSLFFPAY